jgi:hypothetical protein
MKKTADRFLRQWMADNVTPQAETVDVDLLAEILAMECLVAGEFHGFTLQELEAGIGTDLATHILLALTTPGPPPRLRLVKS